MNGIVLSGTTLLCFVLLMVNIASSSEPPPPVENPESTDEDARGIILGQPEESARAPGSPAAPEIPGGIGGGNQLYMGMFQMMAMPMKAPEMPSLPSLPGGAGGQ